MLKLTQPEREMIQMRQDGEPDEAVFDVRAVFGFLRRQIWIIALCGLAFAVLAVVVVLQITPRYTASALVLVDTSAQRMVDLEGVMAASPNVSGVVESQVEVLRSDAILLRALRAEGLEADLASGGTPGMVAQLVARLRPPSDGPVNAQAQATLAVEALRGRTSINRRGLTFVISIAVEDASPARAAQLANAIAQAYITDQIDAKIDAARSAETALSARVSDLSVDLRAIEAQIDNLLLDAAAANLSSQAEGGDPASQAVIAMLAGIAAERQALFAERAALTSAVRSGDAAQVLSATSDATVAVLRTQQAELSTRLSNALAAGDARRGELLSALADVEQTVVSAGDARRTSIDTRLAALDSEALSARQQLRTFLDSDALQGAFAIDLFKLQQEAETTRTVYLSALERLKQAETNTSVQVPDARVLSPAGLPLDPSYPARGLSAVLALILGLGIGGGISLIREQLFAGIVDPAAIERSTSVPVVALIPLVKGADGDQPQKLITKRPMSSYTESVRRLALSLDTLRGSDASLCTMIASASPGEGKSTMALSYAMLSAASGKRTLLIDADFRKPSIARLAGLSQSTGARQFSDMVARNQGFSQIGECALREESSGLTILANTQTPREPTDSLVASSAFAGLIAGARNAFEVVVIDSPPLLPVVDGRILLRYANAICLSVRFGSTTLADLRAAVRELDQPGAPPVLGVLNFFDARSGRGYGTSSHYGYGYGYGYGDDQGYGEAEQGRTRKAQS